MDFSLRNSLKHMRNLWAGEEVIRKQSLRQQRGDCILDKYSFEVANTTNWEGNQSNALDFASFEFLQGDTPRVIDDSLLPTIIQKTPQEFHDENSSTILQKLVQEMAPIVGSYQHERNENLDEYFKAVGVPYIPRKMMGMSSPRLEIANEDDKWMIRTISMIRTVEVCFMLDKEYDESMPAGVTLKNVTTMEGDNLVTISVGPDDTKVTRKYEVTEDGLLLTMIHEKSGQVAKRYFKRIS